MKRYIMGLLMFGAGAVFSATPTDLTNGWICTTNASSAKETADKAADEIMAKTSGGLGSSIGFAARNCRDCNKITCWYK